VLLGCGQFPNIVVGILEKTQVVIDRLHRRIDLMGYTVVELGQGFHLVALCKFHL
jgi:hypothetical protein